MNTAAFNLAINMLPVMTASELDEAWENIYNAPRSLDNSRLLRAIGDELTNRQRLAPKAG